MKFATASVLAALLALAAGAAHAETSRDVPSNYRDLVAAYLRKSLIDPSSIRDAVISPPADRRVGLLNGFRRPAVCVRYNATNGYGGYTGSGSTVYFFENGQVAGARRRQAFCADASYTSFPEAEGRRTTAATAPVVARPAARTRPIPATAAPPRAVAEPRANPAIDERRDQPWFREGSGPRRPQR